MARGNDQVPITIQVRPETLEFINRAAEQAEKSRTVFLREANIAAAEEVLGEEAPVVKSFDYGNQSPIARAAKEAGLSVRAYMKQQTLLSLGIESEEDAPAKKRGRKAAAPVKKRAKKTAKKPVKKTVKRRTRAKKAALKEVATE